MDRAEVARLSVCSIERICHGQTARLAILIPGEVVDYILSIDLEFELCHPTSVAVISE
jgi:hypothetical protein